MGIQWNTWECVRYNWAPNQQDDMWHVACGCVWGGTLSMSTTPKMPRDIEGHHVGLMCLKMERYCMERDTLLERKTDAQYRYCPALSGISMHWCIIIVHNLICIQKNSPQMLHSKSCFGTTPSCHHIVTAVNLNKDVGLLGLLWLDKGETAAASLPIVWENPHQLLASVRVHCIPSIGAL